MLLTLCCSHPPSANAHLELKLFARLRGICQLEALLDALLAQAPPLFSLPALSNALEEGAGAGAAALLAPPAKKKAPAVSPSRDSLVGSKAGHPCLRLGAGA